jgi:hypothetical protein
VAKRITREAWRSLVSEANAIIDQFEKVADLRFETGDWALDEAMTKIWQRYKAKVWLLALANPTYIRELHAEAISEINFLETKMQAIEKLGSDKFDEEYIEAFKRHNKLMWQAEALSCWSRV